MNRRITSAAERQMEELAAGCYAQLDNKHIAEPSAVAPDARVNFTDNHTQYIARRSEPFIGLIPPAFCNLVNTEVDSSIRRYRDRFCKGAPMLEFECIAVPCKQPTNSKGRATRECRA